MSPRGCWVPRAGSSCRGLLRVGGLLDAGLYEHFGGIAGALVCLAALVGTLARSALRAVYVAGYFGALALTASRPRWPATQLRDRGAARDFAGNGSSAC